MREERDKGKGVAGERGKGKGVREERERGEGGLEKERETRVQEALGELGVEIVKERRGVE